MLAHTTCTTLTHPWWLGSKDIILLKENPTQFGSILRSAKQTEFQDTKLTKPERKRGNKIKKQEHFVSAKQTEFQDTKPTKPERKCGNKIKKQETDTKKFNKATNHTVPL